MLFAGGWHPSRAVNIDDKALEIGAKERAGNKAEPISLPSAHQLITAMYPVPISYEGPISYSHTPFKIFYTITRNEPLSSALDRLIADSRGLLTWTKLRGTIVIKPKVQADEHHAMAAKVSISVESASTWEAFKALEKAINRAKDRQKFLHIFPASFLYGGYPRPEFTNDKTLTLKIVNVTAREAVCAVMADSPLSLSYIYMESPEEEELDSLLIVIIDIENAQPRKPTPEQFEFWNREGAFKRPE